MPEHDGSKAAALLQLACRKLMSERLPPSDPSAVLSIAAGVVVSNDPQASPHELRSSADREQKRAKERSKQGSPRPSVIAAQGQPDMIVIEHTERDEERAGGAA